MLQGIKEGGAILKKSTPRKLWNMILLRISYYLSIVLKKVIHWGKPMALSIEPTTFCNLRCPECPSGIRAFTRDTGMLTFDDYRKIIDQAAPDLFYLTLYFQGEPYLNPLLFDFIHYARQKNIYTATSTNAHFLDAENARKTIASGLDKIIISIDGTDQASYEKYRVGGELRKVVEGVQNLVYWKEKLNSRQPFIVIQFLLLKSNQHQIHEIKQLGLDLKVDEVLLKTAQVYNYENGSDLIPDFPGYTRYSKKNGQYRIKNPLRNRCWRMWSSSVVTWDGKVVPCCFDKDAQYMMGDLKANTLNQIWTNSNQTSLRKNILVSRRNIDMCKNCTNGADMWVR